MRRLLVMLWLGCLTLLLLTSCAPTGQGSACAWVGPIYVSPDDHLTPQTSRAILAHDESWRRNCK